MKSSGDILILKSEVLYNICKHFDKGLNTMHAEPKWKAMYLSSVRQLR